MSVLLGQAEGFESLGSLLVEPDFDDPSAANGVNQNASRLDPDAFPASEARSVRDQDVLAARDELVGRDRPAGIGSGPDVIPPQARDV